VPTDARDIDSLNDVSIADEFDLGLTASARRGYDNSFDITRQSYVVGGKNGRC
jgi:hypothetical protein